MRIVNVQLAQHAYPIYVGSGARAQLGGLIQEQAGAKRVVVIADEHVAGLHWKDLQTSIPGSPTLITFTPGENAKSLATASQLYDRLAEEHVERRDLIVALGGGVTGDLAGFVAATWLRGLRLLQVPTTLEAAIDASVGGKTALNHRSAKNLIGVFHQPVGVIIDTDLLGSLPRRDFVAGLSESIKHAAIRDAAFMAWHEHSIDKIAERDPATLMELISRNCEIKADVVCRDEREYNLRAILNYGHTVGHGIEHVLGYELRHGECVALGVLAENSIAVKRGMLAPADADRIAALIARVGLPTRLPRAIGRAELLAAAHLDKKVQGGAVHLILLRGLGRPERVADITDDEIASSLEAISA
ncbi:MAG: 3-dehydroquinate synthase [Phycisphaerae bacterium]